MNQAQQVAPQDKRPHEPFTERDLKVVGKALGNEVEVVVQETDGHWTVSLKLPSGNERHAIETVRGQRKGWRHLENAVHLVQKLCPDSTNVVIEIGGWRFIRTQPAGSKFL